MITNNSTPATTRNSAAKLISFQDESGSWYFDVPLVKFSGGLIYFRREDGSMSRTRYLSKSITYTENSAKHSH